MTRPVDSVIEFLKAEQARGKTHILLDQEARAGLRELFIKARGSKAPANSTPTPTAKPQTPASVAPQQAQVATPEAAPAPAPTPSLNIQGATKAEKLASLREQTQSWQPATSLETLRKTMVFATGNPDAKVMLIGEAPGHEDERRKEPFVGSAGQKLTDILKAMGLSRDEVYISYLVKFRPATARQTTNNRKPSAEEISACMPIIRAEIDIVQPSVIITLGDTAAEGLIDASGNTASLRGSWHDIDGIPARASYHPSNLLKIDAKNTTKREVWEDMLAVMEKVELPISDKQRSYFLPKS